MNNVKKMFGGLLLTSGVLATAAVAFPNAALAVGWSADEMIQGTNVSTGVNVQAIEQQTIAGWVQNFTTWALGIAVVLFVLKVVLTAIDQMVFSKGDGNPGFLTQIPLIGAYDLSGGGSSSGFSMNNNSKGGIKTWKDVWLHFAKNVAIVAGAWVLVQVVMGIILWVLGGASAATGNSGN